jgi:hypothetical protein
MTRSCRDLLVLLVALAGAAGRAAALQNGGAEPRSTLDGVFTEAQAVRGEARFRAVCVNCHSVKQFTTPSLFRTWSGRPLRDLFENVRSLMPDDDPGGLDRQTYVDVLAYLLKANGYPAGAAELPVGDPALRKIRIDVRPEGTGP